MKKKFLVMAGVLGASLLTVSMAGAADGLDLKERLGKKIFFDNISDPDSMSCASCHAPRAGWTGPISGVNMHGAVYRGAVPQRFGNRKPPSAAYATLSPVLYYDETAGLFVGGNFWDGRATGWELGNPAADQAGGPFLNPVEQNMPNKTAVCLEVKDARYADLFEQVWGVGSLDCSEAGVDATYDRIALSIAAYEASSEVNQFSSKYDAYLAGNAELTEQEARGLELFNGKAMCSMCHVSEPGPNGEPPLFTDFTYDNIGTPKNPENPFYEMDQVLLDDGTPINPDGASWVDPGLGGFLETVPEWAHLAADNYGKHKVPTLRNVGKKPGRGFTKAYMHNGVFKSLAEVVHFYNTRDVLPFCEDIAGGNMCVDCWPEPEVKVNVNTAELGDLGLSAGEEADIVAFLETLSDGYGDRKKGKGRRH